MPLLPGCWQLISSGIRSRLRQSGSNGMLLHIDIGSLAPSVRVPDALDHHPSVRPSSSSTSSSRQLVLKKTGMDPEASQFERPKSPKTNQPIHH